MPSKKSLLSAAAVVACSASCTTPALAFTSVTSTLPSAAQHQGQAEAAASPLFRAEIVAERTTASSPLEKASSQLFMTSGSESSEAEEATKQEEKAIEEKKDKGDEESTALINKSSSAGSSGTDGGFFLTLLLAPPLIAKFCIVLLVKFATDAVVYPTLFLWRLASRAKRRILRVFGIGKESKDTEKPINGDENAPIANGDFA